MAEIGAIAAENGIFFHTDATQAVGHVPLDVQAMNIHMMSMSAHKLYGPKGVGAFYRRRSNPRVQLMPIIYGGGHERGLRSGTLNVPAIVGFGEAARLARREMVAEAERFYWIHADESGVLRRSAFGFVPRPLVPGLEVSLGKVYRVRCSLVALGLG